LAQVIDGRLPSLPPSGPAPPPSPDDGALPDELPDDDALPDELPDDDALAEDELPDDDVLPEDEPPEDEVLPDEGSDPTPLRPDPLEQERSKAAIPTGSSLLIARTSLRPQSSLRLLAGGDPPGAPSGIP
jgi:hypothetical protein